MVAQATVVFRSALYLWNELLGLCAMGDGRRDGTRHRCHGPARDAVELQERDPGVRRLYTRGVAVLDTYDGPVGWGPAGVAPTHGFEIQDQGGAVQPSAARGSRPPRHGSRSAVVARLALTQRPERSLVATGRLLEARGGYRRSRRDDRRLARHLSA